MLEAQAEAPPDENPKCQEAAENGRRLAASVLKAMDEVRCSMRWFIRPGTTRPG